MKIRFIACICILMGSFCGISAREFPICMYGVDKPEYLPLLKKAGFTCVQSYKRDVASLAPLATAAKKQGFKTVFHPQGIWGTDAAKEAASWPMLAWYIVDEPDVARWGRTRVQEANQKAKQMWPEHQTALVIGQGRTRVSYYDLTDNMMVDWYPVPHLELTSFGDNVAWTKQGMQRYNAGDRPLWGVVQAFDWKEFKQHRADDDRVGRFPTKEELRFMSYDGIINGATGLFYFVFTTNDQPLPTAQPEWWNRLTAVTKELAKLRPVFENGQLMGNATQVPQPLVLQAWQYKGHTYFIFLNRSAQEQTVPAPLLSKQYKLLFGNESKKTEKIAPYDVWILKK